MSISQAQETYNRAKLWQIAFFSTNNASTNLYRFIIGFVSYYATGFAGLTVVVVSTILTSMRLFDAVTDPIIGYITDKTETKFGKYRPLILLGNAIMLLSIILMYNTHAMPESFQFLYFILTYLIHVIGYTFQVTCTKAGQTVLTNDPKQRPLYSVFDGILTTLVFVGGQVFVASYLVAKHGDFNMALFKELNTYGIILSGVFAIMSIIGLWEKDNKEYYGLAEKTVTTKFRDYLPILKGNRPLQMLTVAAATDKLASGAVRQPAVQIMLYGIVIGDYALSGTISMITLIPSILITMLGVFYSRKVGLKRAFVTGTWFNIIVASSLIILFLVSDPTTISVSNIGVTTVFFIGLMIILSGLGSLTNALVIPMVADVSDFETYKSGRYVPGMLGATFAFIDKLVSSLSPAVVGFMLAMIGYRDQFPQLGESVTMSLFVMMLVLQYGIPILGYIASVIAMKFYVLDDKKMAEIQEGIAKMKEVETKEKVS